MNKEIAIERLNEVIKVDTTSSTPADFLATHVPFRRIKLKHGGGLGMDFEEVSEEDIWERYVRSPGERHQFVVVQGANGTGKSHLIRWLDTKFKAQPTDGEIVIFIRRSDNSLKGTIKQLLTLKELQNLPHRDVYERLVAAGRPVNPQELKNELYHALLAKVQTDITNGNTDILKRNQKKKLLSLLSNQTFCEAYLMKPNDLNAPIERIYRRVATDGQLKGYNEEPARFQPSDFYLSEEFVERLQNDQADGKAIDFVYELLEPEDERPAATATYLNQFLDSVIQKAAGIHPGDFESIFAEIRHELYLHGERLTLLIEDITAFTGINESLLNVLIDEHTGTTDGAGSERCRLSSVVGTTTQFYGEFRDNFRNRVTEEIYIEDTALTADRDDALLELSARYLNALSLPASDLATWAEEGALAEKLPIHQRVEQSYWPTFTLPTGQVLSLYPFTALALRNLVAGMREGQRTPRYFLTDVMRPTILHVIKDTLVAFPPVYTGTKPNLQWQNTEDRIYIMGQCSEEEQERLNRFVCIWGDGTAKQIEQDNISYLAGIPLPIYQELGFPNIHGRKYTTANTNAVSPLSSVTKKVASVTQNTAKTPTKYDSQRENLDKWLNGDVLMDDRNEIRNDLSDFLCSAINWQEEGVSFDHLNKIVGEKTGAANRLLAIERCSRGEGIYQLPARLDTYRIIDCLLKWRHLGQCSWTFAGAEEALYYATAWLYKIKDEVVQTVKESTANMEGTSAYAECALSVVVCCHMLSGGDATPQTLAQTIFAQDLSVPLSSANNLHCKDWNNLLSYLNKRPEVADAMGVAHDYFNIKQSRYPATKTFFNLSALQKSLDRLSKHDYLIPDAEELGKDDSIGARKTTLKPAGHIAKELPKVVAAEQAFWQDKMQPIIDAFDLEAKDLISFNANILVEFAVALEDFFQAMGKANKRNCVAKIKPQHVRDIRNNADKIAIAVRQAAVALEPGKIQVILPQLAQASLGDIKPLLDILQLAEDSIKKTVDAMPGEPPMPKGYVSPLADDRDLVTQKANCALAQLDSLREALSL